MLQVHKQTLAICCSDRTCTSNSQLLLSRQGGGAEIGLQYFKCSMGLKQTHCITTGLLAACHAAEHSFLSSEGNGSSYSSSSQTVVKGMEQGLYLCTSCPFTIGMHHLLWVCFMYYLLWVCLCAYSLRCIEDDPEAKMYKLPLT